MNADLDVKVDEMAQLNMQLFDMNRMKDEFMANMSHELRTPLNSIGFSEVWSRSIKRQAAAICLQFQPLGTDSLEMINEILDLAKIERANRKSVLLIWI